MFPYQDIGNGRFYLGDCLQVMRELPDKCVDMILCDLPYGTTACKWDTVIPFAPLWEAYKRIAKPSAAIVLTAAQPFTSALVMSNVREFRYEWIWEKTAATGFLNAKKSPLKAHENICVFYADFPVYNPKMSAGHTIKRVNASFADHGENYGKANSIRAPYESSERFPRSVQKFPKDNRRAAIHPTQKPVALFEYLIKTYTNAGAIVLDNCAGSGTTAVACENLGRRWVCIEQDQGYADKACERIRQTIATNAPFRNYPIVTLR